MGHARYTYTFESPTHMRFLLEHSQDGKKWAAFVEGDFKRA
jgi:hypothetical protein